MINAQKLADEKWERELLENASNNNMTISSNMTSVNMANLESRTTVATQTTVAADDSFGMSDMDYLDVTKDGSVGSVKTKSMFDGLFGPTKEQRKAQQEFEKWQKSFKEKIPEGFVLILLHYML
jgi:hypothetical protein